MQYNSMLVDMYLKKDTKPNWEPFRGNNHIKLLKSPIKLLGEVSFTTHIGKPLTQDLWDDLIYRLQITEMCIYYWHITLQWTFGWTAGHVNINLDEKENVREITYFP